MPASKCTCHLTLPHNQNCHCDFRLHFIAVFFRDDESSNSLEISNRNDQKSNQLENLRFCVCVVSEMTWHFHIIIRSFIHSINVCLVLVFGVVRIHKTLCDAFAINLTAFIAISWSHLFRQLLVLNFRSFIHSYSQITAIA